MSVARLPLVTPIETVAVKPPVPLVSVVIPAYNAAPYLPNTLASVWSQTMSDLECIVVDDGSTDGTADLLRATRDSRLRCIRQDNAGVAAARNRGMAEANGTWIALLDADDAWVPSKLEIQLAATGPQIGMVLAAYTIADEAMRPRGVVRLSGDSQWLTKWLMLEGNGAALPQTALIRRDVLSTSGPFREDLSTSADLEFALRVSGVTNVVMLPDVLAIYRTHKDQMHHESQTFERDMLAIFGRTITDSAALRRAKANLYTRIAFTELARAKLAAAGRAARLAWREQPSRLGLLPARALVRRVRRRMSRVSRTIAAPPMT